MSEYKSAFFIVPSRILDLPELEFSFLKIYETIFQFWNHGKECYLSNQMIKERTGIQSESTIRQAFIFFEKHGELQRKTIKGKRYLIQPHKALEVENMPVATATGGRRHSDGGGVAIATHNNKKLKEKNINKSFYKKINEKKHDFCEKKDQKQQLKRENPNEPRCTLKFWEPGNPDYDRVNAKIPTDKKPVSKNETKTNAATPNSTTPNANHSTKDITHGREKPGRNIDRDKFRGGSVRKVENYLPF